MKLQEGSHVIGVARSDKEEEVDETEAVSENAPEATDTATTDTSATDSPALNELLRRAEEDAENTPASDLDMDLGGEEEATESEDDI